MRAFPILVGDIGGTNARFALVEEPNGPLRPLPRQATADHPSPRAAIEAALAGAGAKAPRGLMLAVAAPVKGPHARLTNANWFLDADVLQRELAAEFLLLTNDFVPVAACLDALAAIPDAIRPIGEAREAAPGPRIVLGPGTGFGAAAAIPAGKGWRILPTEAGHVSFGPNDRFEEELFALCERDEGAHEGRLAVETLLSGPGLARLSRALDRLRGRTEGCADAGEVTAAAERGEAAAIETLAIFARLLGRFASDLALTFVASGGVYLAGGIAPRLGRLIDRHFREAFEDKAPHRALMSEMATSLILHPDPALVGLAAIAAAPGRFDFPHHVSGSGRIGST